MRRTLTLVIALLLSSQIHASYEHALEIEVDGRPVQLALTSRNAVENPAFAHGEHFRGHIEGEPDSWVRVSRINGQWQGLVSTTTGVHVLEPTLSAGRKARALAELDTPLQCGADTGAHETTGLRSAMRASIGYFDTLCEDAIDGVCAGVEVEMVFDQAFVSSFPGNHQAQGASLLNMVEGFYLDSFGIRLNNLGMTFLDKNVFAAKATSTDYLNEIRSKKMQGSLDFVKNPSAILHVVRGKPFDDITTAGIAWINGLCDSNGYSSSTSVLFRASPASAPSLGLTALIATHEIGHNLGAKHDTSPDVGCPSGYIMDAMVNPYANDFSSCSETAIKGLLGNISGWTACTNYPVRMNINAAAENSLSLSAVQAVTHQFAIDYAKGFATPQRTAITLNLEGAEISDASVEGGTCRQSGDPTQMVCSLANISSTSMLTLTLQPRWALATIQMQPDFGSDSNVFNVADNNGRYTYQLITAGPAAPTELQANLEGSEVTLDWRDNTTDENGFEIQRRTPGERWSVISTATRDSTRYRDALTNTGTYEYRVLALRADINSAPSNTASVAATSLASESKKGGDGGNLGLDGLLLASSLLFLRLRRPLRRRLHS